MMLTPVILFGLLTSFALYHRKKRRRPKRYFSPVMKLLSSFLNWAPLFKERREGSQGGTLHIFTFPSRSYPLHRNSRGKRRVSRLRRELRRRRVIPL